MFCNCWTGFQPGAPADHSCYTTASRGQSRSPPLFAHEPPLTKISSRGTILTQFDPHPPTRANPLPRQVSPSTAQSPSHGREGGRRLCLSKYPQWVVPLIQQPRSRWNHGFICFLTNRCQFAVFVCSFARDDVLSNRLIRSRAGGHFYDFFLDGVGD